MNNLRTFEEYFWKGKFYFPWQKPKQKEIVEDVPEETVEVDVKNSREDIDPYNEERWDDKEVRDGFWVGDHRIYCPRCRSGNVSSDRYELLICDDCGHVFGD